MEDIIEKMSEKEKMLVASMVSFSLDVFQIFFSQGQENTGLFGKGLI